MLDQISKHSLIDISIKAKGDLHVDLHHTTEDSALALGEALNKALGERKELKDLVKLYLQWTKLIKSCC